MNKKYPVNKISDFLVFNYGKGLPKSDRSENAKYPVYGANGELGRSNSFLVEGPGIIVGRKGSAGQLTLVTGKYWPTDVTYYITDSPDYDLEYVYQLLKSLDLPKYAKGVKPGINRNEIYNLEVPLPDINEQRKIVRMLDQKIGKVRKMIGLHKHTISNTEKILSTRLVEIFEKGKEDGWIENSLADKEIVKMTSGGTPNRSISEFYKGDIPWLKSGELKDSMNIIDSAEKITEDAVKKSSAKIFPKGTVLFAMYGATAGKIGIIGIDASTNQAVAGMIPVSNKLNNKFLYYFLMKKREDIIAQAWGGAQPNLSQTILKTFSIPLPDIITQIEIVAELDKMSKHLRELTILQSEQLKDLEDLKKVYLRESLNGEL